MTTLAERPWRSARSKVRKTRYARVMVDTERVTGGIGPKVDGNFIERLGRCIGGGVSDEKSRPSDSNGFRKNVLQGAKGSNVASSCARRALRTITLWMKSVRGANRRQGGK